MWSMNWGVVDGVENLFGSAIQPPFVFHLATPSCESSQDLHTTNMLTPIEAARELIEAGLRHVNHVDRDVVHVKVTQDGCHKDRRGVSVTIHLQDVFDANGNRK